MLSGHPPVIRKFVPEAVDHEALAVVAELHAAGYVAYFVGGCVRDLLLGGTPKDFDIATDARPREVKEVFGRRCRIIGRRFRLAHVRNGSSLLEVATFRGSPEDQETADDESGFVVRANTFGTPEEDAHSRDLTINGLFYDPLALQIIDYVDGLADIDGRTVRTIGGTEQRFREDPVRLLRAIRFSAKLDLELHPDILEAAPATAPLLGNCPEARVSEELFRMLECGNARAAVDRLARLSVLPVVLPEVFGEDKPAPDQAELLDWLGLVDRLNKVHGTLPRASLFTLFCWPFVSRCLREQQAGTSLADPGKLVGELVRPAAARLSVPVRYRQRLRQTVTVVSRLRRRSATRPRTAGHQLRSPALPIALTVARMRYLLGRATPEESQSYEHFSAAVWKAGISPAPIEPRPDQDAEEDRPSRPRRGRRRKPKDG